MSYRILLVWTAWLAAGTALGQNPTIRTENIRIRDPFIYTDAESGLYYLYAQSGNRDGSDYQGVEVYTSTNFTEWTAPKPVLVFPKDAGVATVWAPEVHVYDNAFYLFVTLTFDECLKEDKPVASPKWPEMRKRGTWIYRAAKPEGPFSPIRNSSHTPAEWMALDGTLHVEKGRPYMVFCQEWVQLIDGAMMAVALSKDLSDTEGVPVKLFNASEAPGVRNGMFGSKVTDGPFLYRGSVSGVLYMIWSTFIEGKGYCVLRARSASGSVLGAWVDQTLIYTLDGGHGMIFKDFDGRLLLALHQPNKRGCERLRLVELADDETALYVVDR